MGVEDEELGVEELGVSVAEDERVGVVVAGVVVFGFATDGVQVGADEVDGVTVLGVVLVGEEVVELVTVSQAGDAFDVSGWAWDRFAPAKIIIEDAATATNDFFKSFAFIT
ncbi:hypothetical protein ACIGKR_29380 [Rhodococcus qingshengii]|uniref:hypothetical protein n=2 Tax=Rhodococcus qingshengii TaxID=334542 RepID=UPI0037C7DDB2